jgi:hypothetical protein
MEDVQEIPATLSPAQPSPHTSAQPENTSRHAENQNEFSPYIAWLECDIANPRPHSEICEEISQGILKQSLPTERSKLMWRHAIAIGPIRIVYNRMARWITGLPANTQITKFLTCANPPPPPRRLSRLYINLL